MAGDWTKWIKGFARKPEVTAAASALGLSRQHVAAACMELFEWVDSEGVPDDEHDPDSDITIRVLSRSKRDESRVLLSRLDEESRCPGLASALVEEGWIELNGECAVFKRAARHNTQTAKTRALASRRQRAKRSKESTAKCHAPIVTREEKRREEKKKKKDSPNGESVARGDVPTPDEFFSRWRAFTEKKGLPIPLALNAERRKKIKTRLAKPGWFGIFRQALGKLPIPNDAKFTWQPDLDWLIENDTNATKLAEGKYDSRGQAVDTPTTPAEAEDDAKYL